MPGERRELTPAEEVIARVLVDAIVEDILEEKASAASQLSAVAHEGEQPKPAVEAACQ
jgi:hypothetical protein